LAEANGNNKIKAFFAMLFIIAVPFMRRIKKPQLRLQPKYQNFRIPMVETQNGEV